MKKSGKCPKCGCDQLKHLSKLSTGGGLTGKEGLGVSVNALGSTMNHFEAYTCLSCGYTEVYLPEKHLFSI